MTNSRHIHTVCPHCKRPVVALREQHTAHCPEHGNVVPMRSAIVNSPLRDCPEITKSFFV